MTRMLLGGATALVLLAGAAPSQAQAPAGVPPVVRKVASAPPAMTFRQVVAGSGSSCGIAESGRLYCWGARRTVPGPVAGAVAFAQVAVGGHYCGLTADGTAYCWGSNSFGTLGDGTTTDRPAPTAVAGALRFALIRVGTLHTCALTPEGRAYCWGSGRLGTGATASSPVPVAVAGELAFTDLTVGPAHACGVARDGRAHCWGRNADGELGDGTTQERQTPTPVSGGLTFRMLSAGSDFTCGIATTGSAYCWGKNGEGQLGNGTETPSSAPVAVASDIEFVQITAGDLRTCARTGEGRVYCWGNNAGYWSALGDGTDLDRHTPTPVAGDLRFTDVSLRSRHACGLTSGGQAYCWGGNSCGEVGDGSWGNIRTVPSAVRSPGTVTDSATSDCNLRALSRTPVPKAGELAPVQAAEFTQLAPGGSHTCALDLAGRASCWGSNREGQLGDSSTMRSRVPRAVVGGLTFVQIASGTDRTCGVTGEGDAYCWGDTTFILDRVTPAAKRYVASPVRVASEVRFARIAVGEGTDTCALSDQARAYCWGSNNTSGLGLGPDSAARYVAVPAQVSGDLAFTVIRLGSAHTCGLTPEGAAYCWGKNGSGQLGAGLPPSQNVRSPVPVAGGLRFTQLTTTRHGSCGLTGAGQVHCWGSNRFGHVGDGTEVDRHTPTRVASALKFTQIAAGGGAVCALSDAGQLFCWGGVWGGHEVRRPRAQGGSRRFTDVEVATALEDHPAHVCGVSTDRRTYCWGNNREGQLGDGSREDRWTVGPSSAVRAPR